MTTFILCAIGFLGLTLLMHEGHRRDKAKAIEQVEALTLSRFDTEVGRRDDEIAHRNHVILDADRALRNEKRLHAATRAVLEWEKVAHAVTQAERDCYQTELHRVAEQVAGKCLWPTLAEDDVVIEFPKRGRA